VRGPLHPSPPEPEQSLVQGRRPNKTGKRYKTNGSGREPFVFCFHIEILNGLLPLNLIGTLSS